MRLKTKRESIPGNQLRNYGSTVQLLEDTLTNETIMTGLERFFEKARKYAENYNAPYVLIQNLNVGNSYSRTGKILGLAQLLINNDR